MATTPPAKSPSIAIARALRRLGLTQGKGKDFRVDGDYNSAGERTRTYALLLTRHADETVAAHPDDIERWVSEDGGWSFTVNVRYHGKPRPFCTVTNGVVEKIREEPPAPPADEPAPEPQPQEQPEGPAGETAALEDPAQPEEDEQPPADEPPADEPPAGEPPAEEPRPSKGWLTITHTRADGTLLDGSRKGDGVFELVKPFGFWPFRSLGMLGIRHSRDREAQKWRIDGATAALREDGWEVTVEIDESQRRSFEEAEADRLERAEDRAERFGDRADRASTNSDARYKAALGALDGIEPGQPILRGHHSERGHRRAIERSDNHMRKSIEESGKAQHYSHRAEAAEKYEERRYDPNRTRRRLEKLGAELRQQERYRDEEKAAGRDAGRYERRIEDLREEITGWEKVVEQARQNGMKLWEADDFAPRDFAMYGGSWFQVLRVNPKTLSIAWNLRLMPKRVMTLEDSTERGTTYTFGIDYTKIQARCPEAAMLAFLADGKVPGTKSARTASEAQPASEVRAAQAAKPKPKKKRSDPRVPKKVKVECRWDATEATLTWLDGKGEPHKLREPVTVQAPEGTRFTESVWSRSLLEEVTRLLAADGFQYREGRWSGSPGRGIVHAIEPTETTEAPPEQSQTDQAAPVEPPAEEPPASGEAPAEESQESEPEPPVDEPEPVDEPPAEEPPAAEPEPPAGEPAPPAEDPKELRLQRQQAAALGWSTGQAEFVIAAAAGRLYLHQFGSLYCRDIPGTAGRLVSNHRLSALQKAGFVTVGAADANRERPILVTVDGRRAVAVWKRWKPQPVEKNREQECEKLRPLLHGVQARRLAEQAAKDEVERKAASAAFREAHQRLMEWEDREDRLWAAWARVQGIVYRLQRRPAGWVPTEEEIETHGLDAEVVAELRADAENPQPRPVLPDLKQRPMADLPPLEADNQTPEQLDLFAVA
ncbi:DUF3560 domain-containing protein [Streptomyces mirabilis]|uniref:DUF3560 domain-containing protein n=1 Tax=Streptomyces mirabilis TaxID=68239 RepID=UPI00225163BD|nr:DUF3560 domain-containing protein [Streptomyces mirabilis]MCX4609441.1 DUF3560 domain-containing protein [Streptomyces mirabilis]